MKNKDRLRAAFEQEWRAATVARQAGMLDQAFYHLERGHILSQRLTWVHVKCHLAMWRIGWRRRDAQEVIGQAARIVAALLFSRLWVPIGNTGGANVSALQSMPIPDDLNALLRAAERDIV